MVDRDNREIISSENNPHASSYSLFDYIVCAVLTIAVLCFALNTSDPWESDQPAKAAQIRMIAETNDYTLNHTEAVYRLKLFPLYYSASAALYNLVGGPIFRFMNISSVPWGVVFVLSLAVAFKRVFNILPIWTTLALLAMPLVVITFSYGNEVAWALALFALSMALATSGHRIAYFGSAVVYVAAVFCRVDFVFLGPFWLIWAVAIAPGNMTDWEKRGLQQAGIVLLTVGLLWLLLIREIPQSDTFEWNSSLALLVANLVYPFNPTIVFLVVPSWLWFKKKYKLAAWSLLLLLLPVVFYIGHLSSPKYVAPLIIGYALLVSWLLGALFLKWRIPVIAGILVWCFVAVSIYGVFGPVKGSRWYLPTADGPCPSGAYLEFYRMARAGVFQVKQVEHNDITAELFDYVEQSKDSSKVLGHMAKGAVPYLEVERGIELPDSLTSKPTEEDKDFLMVRTGYLNRERMEESWNSRVLEWLKRGQVRGVGTHADSALPAVIKIGDSIPEGEDSDLANRILFMDERYKSHMVFTLPEFIPDYLPTCWSTMNASAPENAIYHDAAFYATDDPTTDCVIYGYVWPARYYNQKLPQKF